METIERTPSAKEKPANDLLATNAGTQQITSRSLSLWAVNVMILMASLVLLYMHAGLHHACEIDPNKNFPLGEKTIIGCDTIYWLSLLFKEIGFAAIVAVILNFSIEAFNRKRHQAEKEELINEINIRHANLKEDISLSIANNVFSTVYKRNISEKMFREVEYLLLRQDIHRSEYRAKFTLQQSTDHPGKILLQRSQNFTLRNISENDKNVSLSFVSDTPPDTRDFFRYGITIADYEASQIEYKLDALMREGRAVFENGFIKVSVPIKIKKGQMICVDETSLVLREMIGSEAVVSVYPTESMELTVETPNSDFEICVESLHLREVESDPFEKSPLWQRWRLNHPILPGQGMIIVWKPSKVCPVQLNQEAASCQQASVGNSSPTQQESGCISA